MFVLPPRPPVDYRLERVPPSQQSNNVFTPDDIRITQPNIGQFLVPINDDDADLADKCIDSIHPRILNRWAMQSKQHWVIKPGDDAYFLHDIFRRFNVKRPSYRDRLNEVPFPRSYEFEMVCVDDRRLQKLRDKCAREELAKMEKERKEIVKKEAVEDTFPGMVRCEHQPPSWWKQEAEKEKESEPTVMMEAKPLVGTFKRWQEHPKVFLDKDKVDECTRKEEMRLVGQPFKHEAVIYYLTHYPAADIKWRPEKFSK